MSARSRRATAPCSASWAAPPGNIATDPERFRADLRSYEFIAFQPGTTVYYVRKDVAPGMKEPGDIVARDGARSPAATACTTRAIC